MARSRFSFRSAAATSLAVASVAAPTMASMPAAQADDQLVGTNDFADGVLTPATQTTPFTQQTVTTEVNLPGGFVNDWAIRENLTEGVSFTSGKISYTRSSALAYDSGTVAGAGIAKFSNKKNNTNFEIGATGVGVRIADGTLRQQVLVSVGSMYRTFDVNVPFTANSSQTVVLPQNIVDAAKDQGLDLSGTTITIETAASNLASDQEKLPAMCWTPSATVADTVDMSRSKGIVRVGNSFVIPAGVVTETGADYKVAKLPATIAFKGGFTGTVLAPELKISQNGTDQVSTELRGVVGTTTNGNTRYTDYTTPVFGTVSDTFGWNTSDSGNQAMFGGRVNTVLSSPFIGVADEPELGTMEVGCMTHTSELDEAHQQLFGSLPETPHANDLSTYYNDVNNNSAFAADILWATKSGITTGYDDRTFRPMSNVSRAAVAAFMYRLAGSPEYTAPAVSPFSDVSTSYPFYKEISWLASQGITTGYSDGTFRPEAPVQRDAMAAFLYRYAGSPDYTAPATSAFTDVSTGNQFYKEISWLASTKVTTGWNDGSYRPGGTVQRNAMVAFMHRLSQI